MADTKPVGGMRFKRGLVWNIPSRPLPKEVFDREYQQFMSKVPEGANVSIDQFTEKGDPPYNPDVTTTKLVAEWTDEVE